MVILDKIWQSDHIAEFYILYDTPQLARPTCRKPNAANVCCVCCRLIYSTVLDPKLLNIYFVTCGPCR
jgi:hypothetical protein